MLFYSVLGDPVINLSPVEPQDGGGRPRDDAPEEHPEHDDVPHEDGDAVEGVDQGEYPAAERHRHDVAVPQGRHHRSDELGRGEHVPLHLFLGVGQLPQLLVVGVQDGVGGDRVRPGIEQQGQISVVELDLVFQSILGVEPTDWEFVGPWDDWKKCDTLM